MVALEVVNESLRVAIIAGSTRQKLNLKSILENNQLLVVADEDLLEYLAGSLDKQETIADVLLVDLDENDESDSDTLNVLIDKTDLPILFNDSAATRNHFSSGGEAWGKRLSEKLKELVEDQSGGRIIEQAVASADELPAADEIDLGKYERKLAENRLRSKTITDAGRARAKERERKREKSRTKVQQEVKVEAEALEGVSNIQILSTQSSSTFAANCADQIWILGASHGGPQAVKEFLSALPSGLPVGFVLAQHIGSGVVSALVEQLDRVSSLNVDKPRSGRVLKNGELLVSPVDKRVSFDQHGHVILKPIVKKTTFNPSIDLVFQEAAKIFGARAGGIIFSGMGNDGMQGVQALHEAGGTIWAQDADSCVISSMADCARKTGAVQHSASPTALARRLINHIRKAS